MTDLGAFVTTHDKLSGFPVGHLSRELTLYEVRDGLITNIWYIERSTQ